MFLKLIFAFEINRFFLEREHLENLQQFYSSALWLWTCQFVYLIKPGSKPGMVTNEA